ncbi:MAG: hypothetical protein Q9183_003803 [Haloplaca sp. 2 TL-2023]
MLADMEVADDDYEEEHDSPDMELTDHDDDSEEEDDSDAKAESSLAEAVNDLDVDEPLDLEANASEDDAMPDVDMANAVSAPSVPRSRKAIAPSTSSEELYCITSQSLNRREGVDKPEELEEVEEPEELGELDEPEGIGELDEPEELGVLDEPEELGELDEPEEFDKLDELEEPRLPSRIPLSHESPTATMTGLKIAPSGFGLVERSFSPCRSVKFQRLAREETWATYDGPVSNVWFFSVRYMPAQDQGVGVWLVNPALATGHWEGPEIPESLAGISVRVLAKAVARRIIRAFAGDFGHDEGFGPGKPWKLKTDDVKLAAAVADYFRFDYNGARDMAEHVGVLNGEETATMNAVWDDLVGNYSREHMSMSDMVKERMGKAVKGPDHDIHKISLGIAPISNVGEPIPYVLPTFVEDRDEEYRVGWVADSNTLGEHWV